MPPPPPPTTAPSSMAQVSHCSELINWYNNFEMHVYTVFMIYSYANQETFTWVGNLAVYTDSSMADFWDV